MSVGHWRPVTGGPCARECSMQLGSFPQLCRSTSGAIPGLPRLLLGKNRIAPSLSRLYTSKVSYPLTMLSHSAQDSCLKAHYFAPVLRSWPRHKTFSYALYSCLLLKPTSTHHANCPISSACRPTRASILSSHIEGVSTSL